MKYPFNHNSDEIYEWVIRKVINVSTEIFSLEILEKAINNNPLVVLYLGEKRFKSFKTYKKVAKNYEEDILFFHIFENKEIKSNFKTPIVLFKNYEEKVRIEYDKKSFNESELETFFELNMYPYIMDFSDRTSFRIFEIHYPTLLYFYNDSVLAEKSFKNEFNETAHILTHNKSFFCYVNVNDEEANKFAAYFGISEEMSPGVFNSLIF